MIYVTLFVMFFRIGPVQLWRRSGYAPDFSECEGFCMMTAFEFSDLVALSQVTPGPIAVKCSYGALTEPIPGALAATLA